MNKLIQTLSILVGLKQARLYFPEEKQVCVFNKLPILYREFTPKSVQESINELSRVYTKICTGINQRIARAIKISRFTCRDY